MKTQISKPVGEKRMFTKECKEEALEHWKGSGRTAATVAEELVIRAPLIYRWAHQTPLKMDGQQMQAEIRRLKEALRAAVPSQEMP